MIGKDTMKFIESACGGREFADVLISATNQVINETRLTPLYVFIMYQVQSFIALGNLDFNTDDFLRCSCMTNLDNVAAIWSKLRNIQDATLAKNEAQSRRRYPA